MFGTHDVMRAHHMPVCSERMLCALAKQVMHPTHKTRFVKSEGYARQWQSRAWASNHSAHGCANAAWARKLAEQRVGKQVQRAVARQHSMGESTGPPLVLGVLPFQCTQYVLDAEHVWEKGAHRLCLGKEHRTKAQNMRDNQTPQNILFRKYIMQS